MHTVDTWVAEERERVVSELARLQVACIWPHESEDREEALKGSVSSVIEFNTQVVPTNLQRKSGIFKPHANAVKMHYLHIRLVNTPCSSP